MATLSGELIVNRKAPVRVYQKCERPWAKTPPVMPTRDFKNLTEFEEWYRPSFHGDHHRMVRSHYLFTDVCLESIEDAPKVAPKERRERSTPGARPSPTRSRITVDEKEYGSVYKAFEALGLPVKEHGKFRAELKKTGARVFEWSGKRYQFRVVGA